MILRIKFSKHGAIRFIGHLDVMRFFQKAIRRAQIDVVYTKGFSPHQIMSFAQPLSVGHESNGEYMDIEVNSVESCEEIKNRLNAASVPGIRILSVKVLPDNAGNAMASVAAALYTVRFRAGREPDFLASKEMRTALDELLSKEEIIITKKGKSGLREVDIRPGIYDIRWIDDSGELSADGSYDEGPSNENISKIGYFSMLIDASSAGNIKPSQIINALLAENGEEPKENALLVTREETYTDTGDDAGERKLVPLDEIGYAL